MRGVSLIAAVALAAALGACQSEPDGAAREPDSGAPEAGAPSPGVEPGAMPMGGNMADMHRRMMGGEGSAPETEAAAASAADCPDVDQALVDRGREVFNGAGGCTACHGSDATGTALAPNLTDAEWLNIDGSYGALAGLIRTGVPQPKRYPTPMPPMGGANLSDAQICAVAAYVYSLSR